MINISKSRKEKLEEYDMKYSHIPKDYNDRIAWLIDQYHLTSNKMNEIIEKKRLMQDTLQYYNLKIVLFEDPEGAKRPRFRLINRKNFMNEAIRSSNFVHVYSPDAAEDNRYMHRLVDNELISLQGLISAPIQVSINTFFHTPSYFNQTDIILAEIGLHRHINKPDWDNSGKKYSDMLNNNVWLDDNLVIDGEVHKYYSILPRVEIYIRYLNYATNKYQYNQIINRTGYNPNYPISYLDNYGNPVL